MRVFPLSPTENSGDGPLARLGLSPAQTSLYTAVLRLHRATLAEIAQAADVPTERVAGLLEDLVRLGAIDELAGRYQARHPASAIGRLVAARLDRLAEESRKIDEALASIGGLTRHYDVGRDTQSASFPVELVSGGDELYESVVGLALQAPPAELLTTIPDRRTMSDFIQKYADSWLKAVSDELISARVIISADAVDVSGAREVLERLNGHDAGVRVLDDVRSWFFTLGHDTAGVTTDWGASLPESAYNCYLVRAPVVVGALRALFEEMWARSVVVGVQGGYVPVLRLAAQGLSDEAIARALGVSVRTVRGRFADAMGELGAQSRFQAGVAAARQGWL